MVFVFLNTTLQQYNTTYNYINFTFSLLMSIIPLAMGLWLMNFMRLGDDDDDNDYNDIY